jgi:hypothetical protein
MTIKKQLKHVIGKRATRRLYHAAPWVGGLMAVATVGSALRRRPLSLAADRGVPTRKSASE